MNESPTSLFLNRFNFTFAYRPSSKNIKSDAPSRLHSPAESDDGPVTMLSTWTLIAAAKFDIISTVEAELRDNPAPVNTLVDSLFIADSALTQVLEWAHVSSFTRHPGVAPCPSWTVASGGLPWGRTPPNGCMPGVFP